MTELERLRDRVEELEGVLGVRREDIAVYRAALGITREEAKILGLVAKRNVTVTRGSIYTVLYGTRPDCDQPEVKIIDVLVCRMRKPLRAIGSDIRSEWGTGYYMTQADKAALRAFLASPDRASA